MYLIYIKDEPDLIIGYHDHHLWAEHCKQHFDNDQLDIANLN